MSEAVLGHIGRETVRPLAEPRMMARYPVRLERSAYEILIGRGRQGDVVAAITAHTQDRQVLVVVDERLRAVAESLVARCTEAGFNVLLRELEGGKQNKTINTAISLYELLERQEFARDSTIVAMGGGVVGDLVGFVASTYLRGINLVHVPSTLTAMVDSSIGGKVALNFQRTTNAIGNYYHPIVNVIDLAFLDTLPEREYRSGLGEVVKYALICDPEFFDFLAGHRDAVMGREPAAVLHMIQRSIEVKLAHVQEDVRERGRRLLLNYGHTLGHAIEMATGIFEEVYRHGEAVAIGMIAAAEMARAYFGDGRELVAIHEDVLTQFGLPTRVEAKANGFDPLQLRAVCLANVYKDKKREGGKLRVILPRSIGQCQICDDVPERLVEEALAYVIPE